MEHNLPWTNTTTCNCNGKFFKIFPTRHFHSFIEFCLTYLGNVECDPFNQNFWAEVWKFLGGKLITTDPEGFVPFHWCRIPVIHVKVRWQFHLCWYFGSCLCEEISPAVQVGLNRSFFDIKVLLVEFKGLQTALLNNKKNVTNSHLCTIRRKDTFLRYSSPACFREISPPHDFPLWCHLNT